MNRRVLILPVAAVVITAMTVWRYNRGDSRPATDSAPVIERRLARPFELYDQHSRLVKFERYLGRTPLLVVFFDGERGVNADPFLPRLRDGIEQVEVAGVQVIGISTATPFANREAEKLSGRDYPFPLLTDVDAVLGAPLPVHHLWGLVDEIGTTSRTGVFFIDRAGHVTWESGRPKPAESPESVVAQLLRGESPG